MQSPASRYGAMSYGLLASLVGVVIGLYVSATSEGEGYELFFVFSGLGAFLTSAFFWWLLMQRNNQATTRRAVATGILSGLLSHWLCWYLQILWMNIDYWLLGGEGSSLGEAPMDPLYGLLGAFIFSFWSWVFFGLLTVGAGVAIAILWTRLNRRPGPA